MKRLHDPRALGLNPQRLAKLDRAAAAAVRAARLPAAQLAVARRGRLGLLRSYSSAGPPPETPLFVCMSITKALTSAAIWLLLQEGALRLEDRVSTHVPGFGAGGKQHVTVEQLLTHTAGFPDARMPTADGVDPARRLQVFASWQQQFPAGQRFEYHPQASMWVLAELLERCSGRDFRGFVRERILEPLGLDRLQLGLSPTRSSRVAPISFVGRPLPGLLLRLLGLRVPAFAQDEAYYLSYNRPEVRAIGVPSSGAVADAGALALFFQALLDGGQQLAGRRLWTQETLRAARTNRTGAMRDPITGRAALRGLGIVLAGEQGGTFRGFAPTCSADSFGHPGMGGQVAWADPQSGMSFVFLTSGFDRNWLRLGLRNLKLSKLAARAVEGS